MGRRRKRRKVIVKRVVKIPTVFECPHCASRTLSITIKRKGEDRSSAIVSCGNCGLVDDEDFADIPSIYQPIDVYSKFIDLYISGKARIRFSSERGALGQGS